MAAIRRLKIDAKMLEKDPPPYIRARPSEKDLFVFHYVIEGPPKTPYHGGFYHGLVIFPSSFPHSPPELRMLTPSGRFEVNTPLCLSMSSFHPESWNPCWSASAILTGVLSFFVTSESTTGSIETTEEAKRAFAEASLGYNVLNSKDFVKLFPELKAEYDKRKLASGMAALKVASAPSTATNASNSSTASSSASISGTSSPASSASAAASSSASISGTSSSASSASAPASSLTSTTNVVASSVPSATASASNTSSALALSSPSTSSSTASSAGNAADWDSMWKLGIKPGDRFDIAKPHSILASFLERGLIPEGRALVPGCGRGYDVALLASPTRFVVGLEVSETAAAEARNYISQVHPEKLPYLTITVADFFVYTPTEAFSFIYDYTFFCAILPSRRAEWAAAQNRLLSADGELLTMQFPLKPYPAGSEENFERGPPFQLKPSFYFSVLSPFGFSEIDADLVKAEDSPPGRKDAERWARWKRLPPSA